MAYVVRRCGGSSKAGIATTEISLPVPKHETGDLLLIFFSASFSSYITAFNGTGWTLAQAVTTNGSKANYAYKVAASNQEASPTITKSTSSSTVSYSSFVIKDFDAATPVRSSYAFQTVTRTTGAWAALTGFSTLSKGDLAFDYCVKIGSGSAPPPRPYAENQMGEDKMGDPFSYNNLNMTTTGNATCVFYECIQADGERTSPLVYDISGYAVSGTQFAIGVAIKTSSSSTMPKGVSDFVMSGANHYAGISGLPSTSRKLLVASNTVASPQFGYPVAITASASTNEIVDNVSVALPVMDLAYFMLSTVSTPTWIYKSFTLCSSTDGATASPIDASSNSLVIPYSRPYLYPDNKNVYMDYMVCLHDSTGKVSIFKMSESTDMEVGGYMNTSYQGMKGVSVKNRAFHVHRGMSDYEDSGFSWSSIAKISIGILDMSMDITGGVAEMLGLSAIYLGSYFNIHGGHSSSPINIQSINSKMGLGYIPGSVVNGSNLSIRCGLGIGDGTHSTYANLSNVFLDFCDLDTTRVNSAYGRSKEIRFKTSSTDTLNLSGLTIKNYLNKYPTNFGNVVFDASCVTPSSLSTEGMSLTGCKLSVLSSSINLTGVQFSSCGTTSGHGGRFDKCSFVNSKETYALSVDASCTIKDCMFVKGAETYGLNISSAGTYNVEGCLFSGYSTDIYVSATSGTVYINQLTGDKAISVTSAGATVVTNAVSAPGVIRSTALNGSRVYIKNLSDNSLVMNSIPVGGSVYIDTAINNGGATIQLLVRATKEGYIPFEETVVYRPGVGVDFTIVQDVDEIYNTIGKPVGTSFNMTMSGTSVLLSTTSATVQDIYAFTRQQSLSSTGIVSNFNIMSSSDSVNYEMNGFKIKASISGTSISGGYVIGSDGSSPIDYTGQSLFVDCGKAYASMIDTVWDVVVEDGMSAADLLRLNTAVLVGEASGLEGANPSFKSLDGTKTRVSATYSSGSRTPGTVDGT